jgi:hypothetical protein
MSEHNRSILILYYTKVLEYLFHYIDHFEIERYTLTNTRKNKTRDLLNRYFIDQSSLFAIVPAVLIYFQNFFDIYSTTC